MMQCQDKVAVVTGGSRGIGRAIALALGRAGARVAITCARQRGGGRGSGAGLAPRGE